MYSGPYAMPAPYPTVSSQVRPSKLWFLAAGAVALAGIVLGIVIIAVAGVGYTHEVENLHRFTAPGSDQIELTGTGGYSIYYEFPDGGGFGDTDRPLFRPDVTVTSPSGDQLDLARYDLTVTYDLHGRHGVGVYTFRVDESGTYTFDARGNLVPDASIAVGRGIGHGLVGAIVVGVLLMGIGVVAGIIVAIIIGVRRMRSRRLLTESSVPPYPGGPPPGWPNPGAPGFTYPSQAPPPPGGAYPGSTGQPPPPGGAYPGSTGPPPPGGAYAGEPGPPPPPPPTAPAGPPPAPSGTPPWPQSPGP